MKKTIIFLLGCLISICSFAQGFEMKLIAGFENNNESEKLYRRKTEELQPYDDNTGNILCIDENGNLYIQCIDTKELLKVENDKIKLVYNTNFLVYNIEEFITTITDKLFLYSGLWGVFKGFDKNFNQIFDVNIYKNNGIIIDNIKSYYLEDANVLFFWDNKENIYSVVNPGMDKEENRKNFHNTEETKKIFESDVEINGVKIRVSSSNNVFLDGKRTYWDQTRINDYMYQKVNMGNYYIYDRKNATRKKDEKISYDIYLTSDTEVIESSALHPSGDIYVLRMNWKTNTHNLYYIENTWDVEWRTQWYKEHPDAVRP